MQQEIFDVANQSVSHTVIFLDYAAKFNEMLC